MAPTKRSGGVRLCHVSSSTDNGGETDRGIDIIAIHGLDAKSPNTWVFKDPKKTDAPKVNWLVDEAMLPTTVPNARIFTCDWPAEFYQTRAAEQNAIEELARHLLIEIRERPIPKADTRGDKRPILFIASCLGGVILMKALAMANREFAPIQIATRGVIFLATPFHGTAFDEIAHWASPLLQTWASLRGEQVTTLLQFVKGRTKLQDLVPSFTALREEHSYKVFTFYEKCFTDLHPKLPWQPKTLVSDMSLFAS